MEVMISIQDGTAGSTDRLSLNLTDRVGIEDNMEARHETPE